MSSSDPLGFLAGDDSSSESEDEVAPAQTEHPEKEASEGAEDAGDKLPSPDTLFQSVGRPSFLDDPQEQYIDWDRFVKSSEPAEPNVHQTGHYAAIPPPSDFGDSGPRAPSESKLSASILRSGAVEFSAPPVTYSSTPAATDNATALAGKKRPQESANESEAEERVGLNSKKLKTENFRQKEKRKRDLGQSSRGKSYVEEEKRILRQQFAADEIPS